MTKDQAEALRKRAIEKHPDIEENRWSVMCNMIDNTFSLVLFDISFMDGRPVTEEDLK